MKHAALSKLRLIALAVLTLAIAMACKKKDDNPNPSGDIVGTWEMTAFSYDGEFLAFDQLIPVTIVAKDFNNVRITFHSNGTVTGNGGTFTSVLTSKDDPSQVLELPSEMFEDAGTWERAGNTLYITEFITSEERTAVPIAELNATTLRLSGNAVAEGGTGTSGTIDVRFTRR